MKDKEILLTEEGSSLRKNQWEIGPEIFIEKPEDLKKLSDYLSFPKLPDEVTNMMVKIEHFFKKKGMKIDNTDRKIKFTGKSIIIIDSDHPDEHSTIHISSSLPLRFSFYDHSQNLDKRGIKHEKAHLRGEYPLFPPNGLTVSRKFMKCSYNDLKNLILEKQAIVQPLYWSIYALYYLCMSGNFTDADISKYSLECFLKTQVKEPNFQFPYYVYTRYDRRLWIQGYLFPK